MTPPLAALLPRIGWTTGELARRLGVGESTVRGWRNGSPSRHGTPTQTPPAVLAWLQRLADAVEREGVPQK